MTVPISDESRRRRRSSAGAADHPGRAHRVHPVPGRDMRDVPIPPPPGPPPKTTDGTRLVWAPWVGGWQVWQGPCRVCDDVAPLVFPAQLCPRCVRAYPELTISGHRVR